MKNVPSAGPDGLKLAVMTYVIVKAQLPGIYGSRTDPSPRASPKDKGGLRCHKSQATGL